MRKIEQLCGTCSHLRPGLAGGFTCAAPVPYWVFRTAVLRDVEPSLGQGCDTWQVNAIERYIDAHDRKMGLGE